MTSHAYRRCAHCRTVYCFQSSGPGCGENYNNGKYCPNCAEIIAAALSRVPVRFEQVWIDTEDVDAETLIAADRAMDRYAMEKGKLRFKRIGVPLFDMRDPSNSYQCIFVRYEGGEYMVETWSKTPSRDTVRIAMEKNLETGELKPWREL